MNDIDLTREGQAQLPNFVEFGKALIRSRDIDPLYPVLRCLQSEGMTREQQLWHSFLYVCWYHLPVATVAFERHPHVTEALILAIEARQQAWPTGVERRNHRGGRAATHLQSYDNHLQGCDHQQVEWYWQGLHRRADPRDNWRVINERLQTLYGNGRWAAYKHCEVLRRVNGFPIAAPDMGNQFSSGPRQGLATLYGPLDGEGTDVIAELDARGEDLQRRCLDQGLKVDTEELETVLCNWHSLLNGRYYVGHDIDELQQQITSAHARGLLSEEQTKELWRARAETLPHAYLGELHDWDGIEHRRMVAFREQRRIVVRRGSR